jgi:hypothetical protein
VEEYPRSDLQSGTNSQAGDASTVNAALLDTRGKGQEFEGLDQKTPDAKKPFMVSRVSGYQNLHLEAQPTFYSMRSLHMTEPLHAGAYQEAQLDSLSDRKHNLVVAFYERCL